MIDELKIHGFVPFSGQALPRTVGNVARTFVELGALSPLWKVWYRSFVTDVESKAPPIEISNVPERIEAELLQGRIARDDKTVILNMGHSMGAWTGPVAGSRHDCSEFNVTCDCIHPYGGPNLISLKLPSTGKDAVALRDPLLLARTISSLVDIWNPHSLSVRSFYRKMMQPHWPNGPVLGWVNYLAADLARVETMPEGWSWYAGRGEKQIFIFEGGEPSPENTEHTEAFARMDRAIHWMPPDERAK